MYFTHISSFLRVNINLIIAQQSFQIHEKSIIKVYTRFCACRLHELLTLTAAQNARQILCTSIHTPITRCHIALSRPGTRAAKCVVVCRAAHVCMALTSAVANAAAAAAAAGAGKKAAQVQLQAELNNDDDWNKFLLRDGLLGKYAVF